MTRLLLEGTIVLKVVANLLFLILFFLSNNIFSNPIKLNGLVNYSKIELSKEYNYSLSNIDAEGNPFVVLFKNRGYAVVKFINGTFEKPKYYNFNFTIDNAIKLFEENLVSFYAAISRKERAVIIFSLNQDGIIKISDKKNFNSYPAILSKFNNALKDDYIISVSGQNFDGIALLTISKNGKITNANTQKFGPYKSVLLMDLNWDFLPDIIAYNFILNKIEFFYSYSQNNFIKEREIKLENKAQNLASYDVNNDGFEDLILSFGKELKIFYADSVYSFEKKENFNIKADNFFIADLFSDNEQDIIYYNNNGLSINFNFIKNNSNSNINYYMNNIKSLTYVNIKNNSYLFFIDDKNILQLLYNFTEISTDKVILLPGLSGAFCGNNPLNILYYMDNLSLTFNILTYNNNNFNLLYKTKVNDKYNKFKVFIKDNIYYFAMTNGESNNLGFVTLNLNKQTILFKSLFLKKQIHDFSINTKEGVITISIVTKDFGKLDSYLYKVKNEQLEEYDEFEIDNNVFEAKINIYNPNDVFYWKLEKNNNKLVFYRYDMNLEKVIKINDLRISDKTNLGINTEILRYNRQTYFLSFISSTNDKYKTLYNYNNGKFIFNNINDTNLSLILSNKLVSYSKFLFINNSKNGNFVFTDVTKNDFKFSEKLEIDYTEKFFISTINKKTYIIYSPYNENLIKFKEVLGI